MIPPGFESTVAVVVLGLATLAWNVLAYALASTLRSRDAPGTSRRESPSADAPDAEPPGVGTGSGAEGAVRCPECGTANEDGYRYCRDCVAELPDAMSFDRSDGPPAGRLIR